MLRSVLNASAWFCGTSSFSSSSSNHAKRALSSLQPRPLLTAGRMADVLDILGPLDSIFPPAAARFYVGLFRRCIKSGDTVMGSMVHAHLMKSGLGAEPFVSNVLLNVYAKAGHLDRCARLFDEMRLKDLVSWCTLISGYVSHGFDTEAFGILKRIYGSGLKPNHFIVSSVLKGCSNSEKLELGAQVHTAIIKSGLIFDSFVEVGLISTYARFGAIVDALRLFYEIPVKCRVSWNAMISGYVQNGLFAEAVELSRDMCRMGFVMDLVTLRIVASAGSALVMLGFCRNLHAYSIKIALDADNFVVAEHVKLLSKLGEVDDIGKLFVRVRRPDTCLFSLIISGYFINDCRCEAVKHATQLFGSDLNMSQGAVVSVLNLCLSKEEGRQIHSHVLKNGHESYLSVSNALISMYINCGSIEDARVIFTEMPVHDIVSWTAIMSGHVQNGQFGEAFKVFQSCWETGMVLDQYMITTIVNACTGLRAVDQGKQIHALVLKLGIEFSDFLAASFLHMYAKCGDMNSTTRLFSSAPSPHGLVPVNVMLAGYCWSSTPEMALQLFRREYLAGFVPDEFSFSTILGACADLRLMEIGQQLHSHIIKCGLEISDVVVGNAIINLYVKSGSIENACRSFYAMKCWDSNSYAVLISGYVQNRCSKLAVKLFCQMHRNGLSANPLVFSSILRGCANIAAPELGKQVHASVLKTGFLSDGYVINYLVGMYAKSGDMDGTAKTLNDILTSDGIQWKSMITGYSERVNAGQAYEMFELMGLDTLQKEHLSYMQLLRIGIRPSALSQGTFTDAYAIQNGFRLDCSVGNTLFVMFSRYVFPKQLLNVLRKMTIADVDTSTYGVSGDASKAVKLLWMESTEKNQTVHILLLFTYYSGDLVKGGLICAKTRSIGHQSLTVEVYYHLLVKILKQTAGLGENPEFISLMHVKTNPSVCQGYLDMCQSHRNLDPQTKITENLSAYTFTNGLRDSGREKFVISLLENKDRVFVFCVGYQIGIMASQTLLKGQRCPSLFAFHPQECG